MPVKYPHGGPPPWWRRLLDHGEGFLRERFEDTRAAGVFVRDAVVRLFPGLWRRARAAGDVLRSRWPALRSRIHTANDAVERAVLRTAAALPPGARRLWRWARAHAPSRRVVAAGAVVLVLAGWGLWERCGVAGCPDVTRLAAYQPGGASVLLDRHGEPFADLAPMEYATVPLAGLPPYVAKAFVAVEDKRFFEHRGVDWLRVGGALLADLKARGPVQGSSTLSMQLARTLFPERIPREEKSVRRKLLEARMARELEATFSKHEILELYLNHVYLGGGTRGVQAASRYWFGKDATQLELAEAAMLAALPKAPVHYDPRTRPDAARTRRNLVLTLMERQALLPAEEAEDARQSRLDPAAVPDRGVEARAGQWFVQHVRQMLEGALGEDLYTRPLRIHTSLDPAMQAAAEEALEEQLRAVERGAWGRLNGPRYDGAAASAGASTPYLQGAVVMMDARSGDVRAWVGGRDFGHSRFDRARSARRQAGSAFKPFVYAAALEEGFSPSQPILDAPFRLASGGGRTWSPRNYSGGFEGPMSMREALVRSQNVPAVRLAAAVGPADVADLVHRAGIDGEVPASPVAALGVTAVSPVEMAAAFSAFAAGGQRATPRFVLRVEDADGVALWESPAPERAWTVNGDVAYVLTDMLRDVVDRGTATAVRSAGYYGPAAGKTGTTSDATDVWFVGYTPELVGSVWIGFDEVKPLPSRATGGGLAAPVWGRIMARTQRGRAAPDWPRRPPGVVALWVDPETGMALRAGCQPRYGSATAELFIHGSEPPEICPRSSRRRGFGDRVEEWLESLFGRDRGRDRDRRRDDDMGPPDPDLGTPRLPRRGAEEAAVGAWGAY